MSITLAHGNGGRLMRRLIDEVIADALGDRLMERQADATALDTASDTGRWMFSSDSFTVDPLEFPGGNIGTLAINGTVNDLAVSGATPLYLSLNLIIEEGMAIQTLKRIMQEAARAAREAGVRIACGDTKVVPRGQCSGIYIATSGIGLKPANVSLEMNAIQAGDSVIVSGTLGDHGAAVLLARGQFGLSGTLASDCANIAPLANAIRDMKGVRFMRDPTRGGFATVLHEIRQQTGMGSRILQSNIPIHDTTQGLCEVLGFDPIYMACEGRIVAVVAHDAVDSVLESWKHSPLGANSCEVGRIEPGGRVIIETELGGQRFIDELEEEPLPRIC